jgi:hypothetical protein
MGRGRGIDRPRHPRCHFFLDLALGRLLGDIRVVAGLEVDPELRGGADVAGVSDPFPPARPANLIPRICIL